MINRVGFSRRANCRRAGDKRRDFETPPGAREISKKFRKNCPILPMFQVFESEPK
jgi:hypothetical protein